LLRYEVEITAVVDSLCIAIGSGSIALHGFSMIIQLLFVIHRFVLVSPGDS